MTRLTGLGLVIDTLKSFFFWKIVQKLVLSTFDICPAKNGVDTMSTQKIVQVEIVFVCTTFEVLYLDAETI